MRWAAAAAALALLSAAPAIAEAPSFPQGASAGLVPARDMQPATRFAGFEDPASGASISLTEFPAGAFRSLAGGLTAEALSNRGMRLVARETVEAAGQEALLVTAEQAGAPLLMLVAQSAGAAVLATGRPGSGSLDALRAAMLTLTFRAPPSLAEQVDALPFRLPDLAGFQVLRTLSGNTLLLTRGAGDPAANPAQPLLSIGSSVGGSPPPTEMESFARRALLSVASFANLEFRRSGAVTLGAETWFEIRAEALAPGPLRHVVIWQVIRPAGAGYIRAVLLTPAEGSDAVLEEARRIMATLAF